MRSAAVEAERELVEITIELGGADRPMVNTQPPPIKETGHPMNPGHDDVGWVAAGGTVLRLVFEARPRETIVGSPAIGSNRRSRAHRRLDKRNEALARCVLDTRHADTTGAAPADFGGNRDNRFLVCFPPRNADFRNRGKSPGAQVSARCRIRSGKGGIEGASGTLRRLPR